MGKGKERPGKEHGQLRSGLSHLVSLWENSVCCGAHSWGREKLKEADGHVFAFLQMKPQDQGGVWYGVEMSGQIWKCVWWVLLTHFNRNSCRPLEDACPHPLSEYTAFFGGGARGCCLGQWPQERALDAPYIVHGMRGTRKLPGADV